MNRIYSLVWNRRLRMVQVASELVRHANGAASTGVARGILSRHRLAMACIAALALAAH